jgi:hypothetical protein
MVTGAQHGQIGLVERRSGLRGRAASHAERTGEFSAGEGA